MKILSVVGARPQFVKAAAVSRAITQQGSITETMVHTGQHFDADMSDVFFDELGIPAPAYNLGIHGGDHGAMTGRMLEGIEEIVLSERPDWVLVYGDTNSTLAAALAAAKLHVAVAHVEAGLRSFNRRMPEEVNRVLTDHLSQLLLCPTRTAVENLRREGIERHVHAVGDVMYDATLDAVARSSDSADILKRIGAPDGGFALATVHRAENTDDEDRLRSVIDYLKDQARERAVVLPLHPRTRQAATRHGLDFDGLLVCAPVGYLDMARLLNACEMVLTDSGGIQKEAYFHRKPCVTLRDETEWVETVDCGWNRLWRGADYRPKAEITDYGDGSAAQRIVDLLMAG